MYVYGFRDQISFVFFSSFIFSCRLAPLSFNLERHIQKMPAVGEESGEVGHDHDWAFEMRRAIDAASEDSARSRQVYVWDGWLLGL
jgi:hypothetical protein